MGNNIRYDNFRAELLGSELVRILFEAVYDTMWCRLGMQDLALVSGSGKEVPGIYYDKGFLYVPRNLVSWDSKTSEIPTSPIEQRPLQSESFRELIYDALTRDGATLMRPDGIAVGRILGPERLWAAAKSIALGNPRRDEDEESRSEKLSRSTTPRFVTDYGGRTDIFTTTSICLSHLEDYIGIIRDHHQQCYREYMYDAKSEINGAGGKNLVKPFVLAWSNSSHQERFGGYVLIGGYEERSFSVLTVQTAASISDQERERGGYNEDRHVFVRYVSAVGTPREMVLVLRNFHATRYGARPKLVATQFVEPAELGLTPRGLEELTKISFGRYRRILDANRIAS